MAERPIPAEAFPPGLFIMEEMEARGWSCVDVAARMGGATEAERERDEMVVATIIILRDKRTMRLGPKLCQKLGRAFDVTPEFFANLDRAWLDFCAGQKEARERGDG